MQQQKQFLLLNAHLGTDQLLTFHTSLLKPIALLRASPGKYTYFKIYVFPSSTFLTFIAVTVSAAGNDNGVSHNIFADETQQFIWDWIIFF